MNTDNIRLAIVQDTTSAILTQAGLDERYRPDFAKAIAKVYEAGIAAAPKSVTTAAAPLSADEVELTRGFLRSMTEESKARAAEAVKPAAPAEPVKE
jgi:hypothetical protein